MKRVAVVLVGVFEIISGLGGVLMISNALLGGGPWEVVPILWYGIFPILSIAAGVMLLLRTKDAVGLSLFVLLVQIPFIYIGGVSILRVGIAFNLYLTAVWNSRAGANATVLGFNLLALGMTVLFLWCRDAVNISIAKEEESETNDLSSVAR